MVDQSDTMSFFGRDHITGHDHLVGFAIAHQAFQALCGAVSRNEAEVDFGRAEG